MRSKRGSRLVLALVLALGFSASLSLARTFPNGNNRFRIPQAPNPPSRLWPLPSTTYPGNVYGDAGSAGSLGRSTWIAALGLMAGPAAAPPRSMSFVPPRPKVGASANPSGSFVLPHALRSVASGAYKVSPLKEGPVKTDAVGLNANASALVVRYGGEAFLVQFDSSENRAKFVKEFRASIHDAGMDVRHKEP